jgi:hypothetical protein
MPHIFCVDLWRSLMYPLSLWLRRESGSFKDMFPITFYLTPYHCGWNMCYAASRFLRITLDWNVCHVAPRIKPLTNCVWRSQILITGKEKVEDPELQPYIKNGSMELRLNHVEWRDFLKLIEQSRCGQQPGRDICTEGLSAFAASPFSCMYRQIAFRIWTHAGTT